jgi:hypothetical protein
LRDFPFSSEENMAPPLNGVTFMTSSDSDNQESDSGNRLYADDQAKVDAFTKRGVNSVDRKPFRPFRLLLILIAVVFTLSIFSQFLARWAGVY